MHVGPRGWGLSGHLVTGCSSQFYRPRASEVPAEAGQPARTSFAFPNLAKASQECCWPLGALLGNCGGHQGGGVAFLRPVLFAGVGKGPGQCQAADRSALRQADSA